LARINSGLRLAKYEALGNDYLVLDLPAPLEEILPLVPRLCDRHTGIGADGLLIFDPATLAVRIVNPDGSEAEKSGNGLRMAAAHAVLDHGAPAEFALHPPAGAAPVRVLERGEDSVTTELDVGAATVGPREHLDPPGVDGHPVDVGNPHFVVFGQPVTAERCRMLGPAIETHPRFPARTNVQLAEVAGRDTIRIEVWERGAGYTLASGTSAAAAAAAGMAAGLAGDQVTVVMPGGVLPVRRRADGHLLQVGTARRVFRVTDLSS